jgi:hypothetical protein
MRENIAFLELKYGTVYGGYPNFFVVTDVALLIYNPVTGQTFIETLTSEMDVNIVFVHTNANELGHTVNREKFVQNLRTKKRLYFKDEFRLPNRVVGDIFKALRMRSNILRDFVGRNLFKYKVGTIVTFDGNRDLDLISKARVELDSFQIFDIQKKLNEETGYSFSLNKLGVVINYKKQGSIITSNNITYEVPRARSFLFNHPQSAAFDASRMYMVYQEYNLHHQDFILKAALLVNNIQQQMPKPEEKQS